MAESRAKHAFGSSKDIQKALNQGDIDAFDILFLDEDTANPKVGWVTSKGNVVIATGGSTDLADLESQVDQLEMQLETKVDATTVQNMIEEHSGSVTTEEILHIDTEIPESGQKNKIYVDTDDGEISIWDESTQQYVIVASNPQEVGQDEILDLFD